MADAQLKAVISAEDKASKVIAGVSGSLENVQSKLQSMQPAFKAMAAVGTVAFGAIAGIALKTVKDYQDVETANKMLEHAVIDVSHATREQLKATSDLADALERKGVLDSDNIKTGLAQLSTFGLSNKAVQALGGSLSDLAVNQFGVAASGDQLADSANMIAKALNGQFGVLQKSGIRFTEAQKHVIEFGTEMEKVAAINEGFQQNLKFTNDVALSTFAGKLAHVKVQINGLSESIGKALLPAFENILKKISPIIEGFIAWADSHPQLITKILAVSAVVAGLVAALGAIGLVLPGIITTLTAFGTLLAFLAANPIGLVIVAVSALAAGFVLLYQKSETFRSVIKNIGDALVGFYDLFFKGDFTHKLGVALGVTEDSPLIDSLFNFRDLIINVYTLISTQLQQAFDNIALAIKSNLWPALQELWTTIKEELWPALLELWEALKPLAPYFEFVAKVVGAILIVTLLVLIETLKTIILWVTQVITWWAKLTAWVIETGKPVIDGFVDSISGIVNVFMEVVNWVEKAISKVNSFAQTIGKVNLNPFSKSFNLTGRASGGLVSPTRSFIVGENGPELFTPSTYGSISDTGGGGNITVNVYGDVSGKELIEKVKSGIMKELMFNAQV